MAVYIDTINSDSEELMTDDEKSNLKQNFASLINKMLIKQTNTTILQP